MYVLHKALVLGTSTFVMMVGAKIQNSYYEDAAGEEIPVAPVAIDVTTIPKNIAFKLPTPTIIGRKKQQGSVYQE